MAGLVGVRRRMAHEDPVTLRLQAMAYTQAADRGIGLGNYPPDTVRLLARATSLAAEQSAADQERQAAASTARAIPPPRSDARPVPGARPRPPAPPRQPSTVSPVHAVRERPRPARPRVAPSHKALAQNKPYRPASGDVSLPALVRRRVHELTGRWISYAQAVAVINARHHPGPTASAAQPVVSRPPVEAGEK
jgi:hypothetical protein